MSAIEARIIAYSIVGILFAAGNVWLGYHFTAQHYQALMARDALARDQAVHAQQEQTIAALKAQQAATAAAEKQYADLKSTADATADRLARSVSDYAQLRSGLVSATSTAAALADAASQGASRNRELAELVRQATDACLSDSAQLTSFQTWATSTTSH